MKFSQNIFWAAAAPRPATAERCIRGGAAAADECYNYAASVPRRYARHGAAADTMTSAHGSISDKTSMSKASAKQDKPSDVCMYY